jgi:pimeloyl-ACP methyl ester carboxylesterase
MRQKPIYRSPAGEKEVMDIYEKVLACWPVPHEEMRVPTRHGETFMLINGNIFAPPLFLLHGSASNAVSWIGEIIEYSRYFRVYAVDIPGEPGRSSHNRPSWNSPAYMEWMEDILDALKIQKASLLGLSQGGWTALKFATMRPERVEKLVLLTPAGIVPARLSFLLRVIPLMFLGRKGAEAINRITFGPQPVSAEAVVYMNAIMTHFKARTGSMAMYSDEELKRLVMPVLLIGGALDPIQNTPRVAGRLQKLLPQFTGVILPEAGHVLINVTGRTVPFLRGVNSKG